MESNTKEINKEEMQDAAGGTLFICPHKRLEEYYGETKVVNGKTLYLWKCSYCKNYVWDPRDPNVTVGVTGGW